MTSTNWNTEAVYMRVLVLCDDYAHPATLTKEGLGGLGISKFKFEWLEDPSQWSIGKMNEFPLTILSKANNISRSNPNPWANESIGQLFVNYVTQGNNVLFLHSGTAKYEEAPSLCKLMGGIFIGHPPQCPVTVEVEEEHPLTVGSAPFTLKDEHYQMEMNDPKVDLFLHTSSEHGRQPAGWTRTEGKGRVCVLTPGHNLNIWHHPSYQAILRNSLNWCLKT